MDIEAYVTNRVNLIALTIFIESGQGQKNHDEFQIDFDTTKPYRNFMA